MIKTASRLSDEVSAILKSNDFNYEAPGPNIQGARMDLLRLFGEEKSDKIEAVLAGAADTMLGGREKLINVPKDTSAHERYCDAFNDLCGYPDEALIRIKSLLSEGWTLDEIASEWGWRLEKLKTFHEGDRSAYFD